MHLEEAELKEQLLAKIDEGLNDGSIESKLRVKVQKDGKTEFEYKKVSDSEEYLQIRLERLKTQRPESTEYELMEIIAQEPAISLISTNNVDADSDYENTKISKLKNGDGEIYTKGKVVFAQEMTSKKNDQYKFMSLTIQDETGKARVMLEKKNNMNKPIFNALANGNLIGKTLQFKNAVYKTNDPKYEPSLSLSAGGCAIITDEVMAVKDVINKISELGESFNNKNVTLIGKVFYPNELTSENEKKTKLVKFTLADSIENGGATLSCTGFTTSISKVMSAKEKVIKIECKYTFKNDYDNNPSAVVFNGDQVSIVEDADLSKYPASISSGKITVNRLIDMNDNSLYEGFVYIDNLKSQQWSDDDNKYVNSEPFMPICNLPHNKDIDWKRGTKTNDDGQLVCLGCEAVLDPEQDIKHNFQITASISDGEVSIPNVKIAGEKAEKLFDSPQDELIENYKSKSHEKFFISENEKCGGKLFKIRGALKFSPGKDGGYANFSIYNIEKASLDEALAYEMKKVKA